MVDIPTCEWNGKSGQRYSFHIYILPTSFDPNQPGNYIYTKIDSNNYWVPIYIGQGDLNERVTNHHQASCIKNKGATHFHCHKNSVEANRLSEEKDLLANYPQSYQPSGCNERMGG